MLRTFQEMWAELLEELVYGILDHPTIESVHSLNHWNLVVCEDVPARCDPQKPLELVSDEVKSECAILLLMKDSTTKDSPAPLSDDESFHSATEELDEPVGPPPTATDESTTVQSPHRMDQQETSEDKCKIFSQLGRASLLKIFISLSCVFTCFISTVSSDGTVEVTTPPQTTPSPHDTLSGMTTADCDMCELVNVESTHMQECVH